MNIKFGMDNFYVKYLKRFLNAEMSKSTAILGKFDKDDLSLLIKYLNLPNVKDMFTVQREIETQFPQLKTYFTVHLKDNAIQWVSKEINETISKFIMDNTTAIKNYCETCGWILDDVYEWIDQSKDINQDGSIDQLDRQILYNIIFNGIIYNPVIMARADLNLDGVVNEADLAVLETYMNNSRLTISISQSSRKNYFPNKDMLVFVNQFDGNFMYNYAIRDSIGIDDIPHTNTSGDYKIGLYKCKPGQKITIAHNNSKSVRLVIGCSPAILKQDITGFMLNNVVDITLPAGQSYQYTCSSAIAGSYDAHWVCIQCPSNYGNLSGTTTRTLLLEVGDINFDGRIDLQDYHLLARYTATGPGSEEMHWTPTNRQLAVMDTNKDGVINNADTIRLKKYIDGDPSVPSLGLVSYTYEVQSEYGEGTNVSNLLIIDGHYDKNVNIPFEEFITDDWSIHEKFFNYLLGMAIHKYSNSEDISYLQKMLKEYYPEHAYDRSYFYPGSFNENMKNVMLDYQRSKTYYYYGDLNRDNKLDNADLLLLRSYLNTLAGDVNQDGYTNEDDLLLVKNYIEGTGELTPAQFAIADLNHDGIVNGTDYALLEQLVEEAASFSKTFLTRADVNQDGYINEQDYTILQREVSGETSELKQYDISFILGWCDVQSETLLESDINISGNISEVSK